MNRRFVVAGISAAAVLVPASPASAFYCANASKAAGAGVVDESKIKSTNGGLVFPGAYFDDNGTEIMIRGGQFHRGGGGGETKSLGAATDQAIANGPADRGIVEAEPQP